MHWKHRASTTRSPEKSMRSPIFFLYVRLINCIHHYLLLYWYLNLISHNLEVQRLFKKKICVFFWSSKAWVPLQLWLWPRDCAEELSLSLSSWIWAPETSHCPLGAGFWECLDALQGSLYTPTYPLIQHPNMLHVPEEKGQGMDLFLALYTIPGKQMCSLQGDDGQGGICSQGRSVFVFVCGWRSETCQKSRELMGRTWAFSWKARRTCWPPSPTWHHSQFTVCLRTDGIPMLYTHTFWFQIDQRCHHCCYLFFFFWPCYKACGFLGPQADLLAVKAQSPNHWTTREFPLSFL